ncbi:MAG: hypothetical protein ABSA77_11545, partial [Thermoguttaceae bacterium]
QQRHAADGYIPNHRAGRDMGLDGQWHLQLGSPVFPGGRHQRQLRGHQHLRVVYGEHTGRSGERQLRKSHQPRIGQFDDDDWK